MFGCGLLGHAQSVDEGVPFDSVRVFLFTGSCFSVLTTTCKILRKPHFRYRKPHFRLRKPHFRNGLLNDYPDVGF